MNSKKIKSRYENSTTNLKQNLKGKTPLKLSDIENQKTNYSKNTSNINSTTNNQSNNKNKNRKNNQLLNRANSSINNSKIILTNINTSLYNNVSKNKQNNNISTKLEKIISPINHRTKKHNSNNNNFKNINKELIFETYDRVDKELKKNSTVFKTEEGKKNNSCQKQSSQKKNSEKNTNSHKIISSMKFTNINNDKNNSNLINNNKNNSDSKTILKINEKVKYLSDSFNESENKDKNFISNNNKNPLAGPGPGLDKPQVFINEQNKKISYDIFGKTENQKLNTKNNLSKSEKKWNIKKPPMKNCNINEQKLIKYTNQIKKYRGKSPISEISNQTEIKSKENIISSDINNKDINTKKNIKNNNFKKNNIKYKQKYKFIKAKNNYSSNKLKAFEKQIILNNKNSNNNINNNNKNIQKNIEKISNYNQKIPLESLAKNKININKINETILERKKSENKINSERKKEIKIFEQSNRESYLNLINKEKKTPSQNKNSNDINMKNEKLQKNNYIKKINNITKNYRKNSHKIDSSKLRLSSSKGHSNSHYNRFPRNHEYRSNCNSESKKNTKDNNFNSQNNLKVYSTLSNRVKSLSFQNNKSTNYAVIKNPINEIKDEETSDNNINNIQSEENKNNIKINVNNCTAIINILSNWGNKKYLGINEIELFDKKNKKIKISECIVLGGSNQNIKNIFNNKIHSMNESNMWVTFIQNPKSSYNLKIKLVIYTRTQNINNIKEKHILHDLFNEINYILIWNYNGIELNKGIKKIEILDKHGNIYFSGIIPKGEHKIANYHPYKIKIHQNKINNKIGLIKNKNLLISSYKHENNYSLDCNSNCSNSINHSVAQKKNKKNENEDENKKNLYYHVIRLSSNKEEAYSEIKEFFPSNFNQVSSSRSVHKDLKKGNILFNDKKNENKNYKKISTNKNRRIIYEKKNLFSINKENNKDNQNIKFKTKKLSQGNLSQIPNIKQIIPEGKEKFKDTTLKKNNSNILTNFKKNPLKSKSNLDNQISILSLSENQNMLLFKENNSENTLPYILFQKIRINILSNYGNKSFVGLTGFNLIDKYNKIIDFKSAVSIGALPKDLNTLNKNKEDNRIFENLFNGINNTIDENNMWLTVMSPNPYIEISFEKPMTLSKIEIWNYNEALSLDKGTKEIEIMFDSDENRKYCVMLWKSLGIDYFNYYQSILVENLPDITQKIIQLKYNHLKFKYNTNYLPIGFVIKIIFIKNFGDNNIISLKNMEFYGENNQKLEKYIIINDNVNINKNYKKEFFYFHDLYDFRKNEDSICNNLLFVCFEEIVQIKYIKLENTDYENLLNSATRYIQIYLDDILIFEGILNQKGESILLFDKKETNNFKNLVNINKNESQYIFKESINDKCCILTNLNT